jgi:hypothetical protein
LQPLDVSIFGPLKYF